MTKQVYRGGYLAASHMPRDFQHIALNAFLRLLARQKYHAPAALMPARRSTNHSQVLLDASCICIPGAPRDPRRGRSPGRTRSHRLARRPKRQVISSPAWLPISARGVDHAHAARADGRIDQIRANFRSRRDLMSALAQAGGLSTWPTSDVVRSVSPHFPRCGSHSQQPCGFFLIARRPRRKTNGSLRRDTGAISSLAGNPVR